MRTINAHENAPMNTDGRLRGDGVLLTAQVSWKQPSPVSDIKKDLGPEPLELLTLFVTPQADFKSVMAEARRCYPNTRVVACSTAGEIGQGGYEEGQIIAVGFPSASFAASSIMIENIDNISADALIDEITLERIALEENNPQFTNSCAFLVVDGLSMSEDTLTATISPALGSVMLFGGSAGDGADFGRTFVSRDGHVASKAAVLTLIRSEHLMRVFSLDHLVPSEKQMVVTEAEPERRIVKSINAEPAAREYARLVGKDPNQLDRFTFASHPVVVRIGGTHHVRAIQQVTEAGELVFYSAIDEGMVLTTAVPQNLAKHLDETLMSLAQEGEPENIMGCDCILRRIEAEQKQIGRQVSKVLARHNVTGFSTYGEQIGPLHVNHTMSGVAFYRQKTPEAAS